MPDMNDEDNRGETRHAKTLVRSPPGHTIAFVRSQEANTLIVLAPDQASFYEFLKSRQAGGHTVVVLDRRRTQRRRPARARRRAVPAERRSADRRNDTPEAALALMSVLGFMILHRGGRGWTA
jgi:hypothetical protein